MRANRYMLALAVVSVLALSSPPVSAQYYSEHYSRAQRDVGIFYDGLAPYGDWVELEDYGWCWAPRVERGWRPYTRGQWLLTDDGWFWDSDEHFGWATFHYGRWVNHRYFGWVWLPGNEWAPAWVSWRHGNGYTGWAPLPPRATWQTRIGISIGDFDLDAFIGERDYAFVRDRSFVDRGIYQRVLPPTQNVTIINVTTNITNYTFVNERVVDRGLPLANVERALGRRVPHARTVDVDRFDAPRHARAGEVAVFRPEVRSAPERRPQGRSLVKGDEAPPLLVERRRLREQERQRAGNQPVVTVKDVERRRPAVQPPSSTDRRPQQQEAQQRREQARQEAVAQQAKQQEQQRLNRERQASVQQQREQARQKAAAQQAKQQDQQRLDRERRQADVQQQREQARQNAAAQQAKQQEQQRLDREARQADVQQQREQARQKAAAQQAKQQEQQRLNRERQANGQQERNQARQNAAAQQAKQKEQQRLDREKRQADAQDAKKDKGKKKPAPPSPAPPPADEQP